jgi:hypothetical protein
LLWNCAPIVIARELVGGRFICLPAVTRSEQVVE